MFPFDPFEKLILIPTRVFGPHKQSILRFALDTGATRSMLNLVSAVDLECRPVASAESTKLTTASGVEYVPTVVLNRLEVLGRARENFPVLCYALPPSAGVDGILGLDFLRRHKLTIDFRIGVVTLE